MPALNPDTFREILEALPVGIYLVALDRRILFWNQAAERITGYLAQDVIGRSCRDDVLVHCGAEGTPICSSNGCLLTCALRDRKPMEAFLFARHKDGHRIPVHVRSIPLCDEDGKVHAIAEMFQQQSASTAVQIRGSGPESGDGLNIPSLAATEAYLQSRLESSGPSAVFVIQIDGIHDMARQRGLEMVHASMRALVHTLGDLLSMPHFLGRWRDQSFLIVVPNPTPQVFEELLSQLRGLGNSLTVLWWGDRVKSNVIVRGAIVRDHDSLLHLMAGSEPASPREKV